MSVGLGSGGSHGDSKAAHDGSGGVESKGYGATTNHLRGETRRGRRVEFAAELRQRDAVEEVAGGGGGAGRDLTGGRRRRLR